MQGVFQLVGTVRVSSFFLKITQSLIIISRVIKAQKLVMFFFVIIIIIQVNIYIFKSATMIVEI